MDHSPYPTPCIPVAQAPGGVMPLHTSYRFSLTVPRVLVAKLSTKCRGAWRAMGGRDTHEEQGFADDTHTLLSQTHLISSVTNWHIPR